MVDTIKDTIMIDIFKIGVAAFERNIPISKQEMDIALNHNYSKNIHNLIGNTNSAFKEYEELKNISNFCLESLNFYWKNILNAQGELEITFSWLNLTKPDQIHHRHHHPNSILSGVFYFEEIAKSPINFESPYSSLTGYYDAVKNENTNCYNSSLMQVHTRSGNQCIIFPSWLRHEVLENKSGQNRYSIAFNSWFKPGTTIGNSDTSQLHL